MMHLHLRSNFHAQTERSFAPRAMASRGSTPAASPRFEKRHDHALRDIDAILKENRAGLPNFGEGRYIYTLESTGDQKHRCFDMNRDGFSELVMNFTGKEAREWKRLVIALEQDY
jgi:hypothetical protein